MNCYFVFEGKTEAKVYQAWLKHLVPDLEKVRNVGEVVKNNYVGFSSTGYPDCYNLVIDAIAEIEETPTHFDYIVLCLDADQQTVAAREQEARVEIQKKLALDSAPYGQLPKGCELVVLVQNVCIETWFLGNRKIFPTHHLTPLLQTYKNHYDVSVEDPEYLAMDNTNLFGYATKALFHEGYLTEIFKSRMSDGRGYSKSKPKEVLQQSYLQQLQKRTQQTNHLQSFQTFLNFCTHLNSKLHP